MAKLSPDEQKKLQRILIELDSTRNAVEALRGQIGILSNSINELMLTTETVKGIRGLKSGTEILVPVGSDSFIKAKVTGTDKVISGLGADIAAEREAGDATRTLDEQRKEFEESIEKAREELEKLTERIDELGPEAERLLAKSREE
jgi:prefoldin alpha subunit